MLLKEIENDVVTSAGWVCPKCQSSVSPQEKTCPKCVESLKETVEDRKTVLLG